MNARGWRLAALTSTVVTLLGAALLLVAWAVAHHSVIVSVAGDPAATLAEVRREFLGWAFVIIPLLAALGILLARPLARELAELRRVLLQRAYAGQDTAAVLETSRLREVRELASAADRMWTELNRRAAGIESQRSTLAVLVDSVSEGLLRVDGSGRIVFANPECRALLELLPSALGQGYASVVRNSDLRVIIRRALDGERVSGAELAFGEKRVLVSAQPIATASNNAGAGAVLALADLTALRRLEGVRRDFVANVSHELKTPLTSIRGYSETLLNDDVPPEMRTQFLDVIHKNAGRLQQIVDDLLDLSRIESGGWRPDMQDLNAAELVIDVWNSCRDAAEKPRVRFQSPEQPVRVLADPGALRQVLTNLFDNALRYTPDEGLVDVRMTRVARPPRNGGGSAAGHAGPWVLFEVRDNGAGIPRDALPRIFERFYRVDPARSRAEGGTGLGLSIVKHLVESMGGEVSAHSDLGKGTTLRFTLPAAT